ncbi:putative hydrolase [Vibrio phage VCPH]|nr:putative hydrolase [Vibrio phage VCPH]
MIALTGLAGSGKDTAALYFARQYERPTYALAQPIKDLVHTLLEVPHHMLNSRTLKEAELTWRVDVDSLDACAKVYQNYGLEQYEMFHDAWEAWIKLLGFEFRDGHYVVTASLRTFYQQIGTEWGRSVNDEMWLLIAPMNAIITDVRMDNEARFLIDRGYCLFEIQRPNMEKIANAGHSTEQGLDPLIPRSIIMNDGDVDDLYRNCYNVVLGCKTERPPKY